MAQLITDHVTLLSPTIDFWHHLHTKSQVYVSPYFVCQLLSFTELFFSMVFLSCSFSIHPSAALLVLSLSLSHSLWIYVYLIFVNGAWSIWTLCTRTHIYVYAYIHIYVYTRMCCMNMCKYWCHVYESFHTNNSITALSVNGWRWWRSKKECWLGPAAWSLSASAM